MIDPLTELRDRILPLAKRRLAVEGPGESDKQAIFETYLIVAGECRLQGFTRDEADRVLASIPFPSPRHNRQRENQRPKIIGLIYDRPAPLLTGCPRDPHYSRPQDKSDLRARINVHCDDECANTCPMLRARLDRPPNLAVSPYARVIFSSLWADRKLGSLAKEIYTLLAKAQLVQGPHTPLLASSRWVSAKLGYTNTDRHVRQVLARLHDIDVVRVVGKGPRQRHHRFVVPLTFDEVRALEVVQGTLAVVEKRKAEAKADSEGYLDWINEWYERTFSHAMDERAPEELHRLGAADPATLSQLC